MAMNESRQDGDSQGEAPHPSYVVDPSGKIRQPSLCGVAKAVLVGSHLWPFIGAVTGTFPLLWIGVILFWGIMKDESKIIDDQGRELMNVMLTFVVLAVIPIIGWLALLVWIPVTLISAIRGAIATGRRGEYFRYPMTIRFIT